jgi:hypothetical protein
MRRWQTIGLLVCGLLGTFAASGCKDEPSGPGISDATAWRVACARSTDRGDCTVGYDPHGGMATAGDIEVDCYREGGGLTIRLEDPGTESGAMKGRNRSILEVNFIDTEKDECTVSVTEYPRGAGMQQFVGKCAGNDDGTGTCHIEGEMNSEGFDFNGTLECPGLSRGRAGPADWRLEDAKNPGEAMPLQIVNCKK